LSDEVSRSRRLIAQAQRDAEIERLMELLPQGHGSGLDADMVDGQHASELIAKSRGAVGGGGGGGGTTVVNAAFFLGFLNASKSGASVSYFPLGYITESGNEAVVAAPIGTCKFLKVYVQVRQNTLLDGPCVITLRVDGADTLLTVTIPAGETGLFTATADVEVSENSLVCYKNDTSGSMGGIIGYTISWKVQSS